MIEDGVGGGLEVEAWSKYGKTKSDGEHQKKVSVHFPCPWPWPLTLLHLPYIPFLRANLQTLQSRQTVIMLTLA